MSDREGDEAGVMASREDDEASWRSGKVGSAAVVAGRDDEASWRNAEDGSAADSEPMGDEDGPEIKGAGPGAGGAEAVGVGGGSARCA